MTPPIMGESLPKSMGEPLHYPHSCPLAGPRPGRRLRRRVRVLWLPLPVRC